MERLRGRAVFAALRTTKLRSRSGVVSIAYLPAADGVRVGYAISRRVGNAVVRNRLRRRLRSIAPDVCTTHGSYLITLRPEACAASFQSLRDDLVRAEQRLSIPV